MRNDRSAPRMVPRSLDGDEAEVVRLARAEPVSRIETPTGARAGACGARVRSGPVARLVPYSIHQPVGRPFGSTVPPSVAAVGPSGLAAP